MEVQTQLVIAESGVGGQRRHGAHRRVYAPARRERWKHGSAKRTFLELACSLRPDEMLKLKASLPFSSAPASYSTPPPLESAQLVALADRRTAGVALQAALLSHIETQGKLRELGNGAKGVTLELIGRALQSGGGNASPHLKTMAHMGTAWVQLSVLQRDHLDRLTVTCLASLEQFNSSQKDLERTLKEAERRRGVLESLLGKVRCPSSDFVPDQCQIRRRRRARSSSLSLRRSS